jgi:hypothetical protein
VKLVKFRRPKIACSPTYVSYRPKTNAVILMDMGHIKGRMYTGGIGNWEENQKLECG